MQGTLVPPLVQKDPTSVGATKPMQQNSWTCVQQLLKPTLWPPDVKNWLTGKDHDAGKDWRWKEKGMTEDKMVGWHHQFNGHGFGWTLEVGDRQGGLACFSPWGCKESKTTEQLKTTELKWRFLMLGVCSLQLVVIFLCSNTCFPQQKKKKSYIS